MKVFMNATGKFYKQEKAATPDCCEMNFPQQEVMDVLTETPISRIELEEKLRLHFIALNTPQPQQPEEKSVGELAKELQVDSNNELVEQEVIVKDPQAIVNAKVAQDVVTKQEGSQEINVKEL